MGAPPDSMVNGFDPDSMVVVTSTTVADVVLPYPLGEETWPISGTITRHEAITAGPRGDEERESILTYNGTRYATLTIDGETQTIDLLRPQPPPRP